MVLRELSGNHRRRGTTAYAPGGLVRKGSLSAVLHMVAKENATAPWASSTPRSYPYPHRAHDPRPNPTTTATAIDDAL